jgi:Zn-dependent peptidase ImmA (M78 family)
MIEIENVFSYLKDSNKKEKGILFQDVFEILDYYKKDIKDKGYVDIEAILKDYKDIDLQLYNFDKDNEIDANILFKDDICIMKINKNRDETRRRFVMAHLYSHYLFDKSIIKDRLHKDIILYKNNYYDTKKNRFLIDKKANYFAGELLLPESIFRQKNNEFKGDIYKMANFFKVSILAIKIRYYNFGIDIGS